MRIIIDTNIVISAFFWTGTPYQLMQLALEKECVFLSTLDLLLELEQSLRKPKFEKYLRLTNKSIAEYISDYRYQLTLVEPAILDSHVVRDIKDVKVLACAIGGQADYLVTGDEDLLILGSFQDIQIVTARQLLTHLEA